MSLVGNPKVGNINSKAYCDGLTVSNPLNLDFSDKKTCCCGMFKINDLAKKKAIHQSATGAASSWMSVWCINVFNIVTVDA